jgi:hypothetical protein
MGAEMGSSLTHQVLYPLPELLLQPLHNPGIYDFIHSETMALTGPDCMEDGPAPELQCILDSAGQMHMMIVVQYITLLVNIPK